MKAQDELGGPKNSGVPMSSKVSEAWVTALSKLIAVRSPLAQQTYDRIVAQDGFDAKSLERFSQWVEEIDTKDVKADPTDIGTQFRVLEHHADDIYAASRNIGFLRHLVKSVIGSRRSQ